jgi:hypothetical protein
MRNEVGVKGVLKGGDHVHSQDILKFIGRCGSFCLHLFECLSARVPFGPSHQLLSLCIFPHRNHSPLHFIPSLIIDQL